MPYHLEKVGRKYQVITTATGVPHSKAPMSKKKAEEQLRILNAHTDVVEHIGGAYTYDRDTGTLDDQGDREVFDKFAYGLGLIPGVGTAMGIGQAADFLGATFKPSTPRDPIGEYLDARDQFYADSVEKHFNSERFQQLLKDLEKKNEAEDYSRALVRHRSGVDRVYTAKELDDAAKLRKQNEDNQKLGNLVYTLERKQLKEQVDAERIAKQRQAVQERQQQHLSGLNERSRAVQAQVTSARDAAQKSRILQQQRFQDQKLFVTKANDIKRQDFFSQDRALKEARQATIEAEQRRQAIKAAAASAGARPTPTPGSAPQMIPTLGRRLPPSVLWHQ